MRIEHTLTAPPDREFTDEARDVGLTLSRDDKVEAFRLSTGAPLWSHSAEAPCVSAVLGGPHLYALCGDRVLSYGIVDGRRQVLDSGRILEMVVVQGALLATRHVDGRVRLFDPQTDQMVADKVLPLFTRSRRQETELVAAPTGDGICAIALKTPADDPDDWAYQVGCYDRKLAPRWTRSLSPKLLQAKAWYHKRQSGPFHLVLDDQPFDDPWASPPPQHVGRGAVVRWRDGEVMSTSDHTFATIEDERGERVTTPSVMAVFREPLAILPQSEAFPSREARAITIGAQAYVLIRQGSAAGVAGIDLSAGKVRFMVPVIMGAGPWSLEVSHGFPIIRTRAMAHSGPERTLVSGGAFRRGWRATVHDPGDGRILYEDER